MTLDLHQLNIMSTIIDLLVDPDLDTEDVLDVLVPVQDFIGEQIDKARREASPG